jgi:hypothetical protein
MKEVYSLLYSRQQKKTRNLDVISILIQEDEHSFAFILSWEIAFRHFFSFLLLSSNTVQEEVYPRETRHSLIHSKTRWWETRKKISRDEGRRRKLNFQRSKASRKVNQAKMRSPRKREWMQDHKLMIKRRKKEQLFSFSISLHLISYSPRIPSFEGSSSSWLGCKTTTQHLNRKFNFCRKRLEQESNPSFFDLRKYSSNTSFHYTRGWKLHEWVKTSIRTQEYNSNLRKVSNS